VAAAEHESALRAAKELNVSPPAISGAIASLEQIVHAQLFIRRHARGLVLTDAGRHLLMEARDTIERVNEVESIAWARSRPVRSRISLGCLGDSGPTLLPPLVRAFKLHYPNVDIRWHTDAHAALMRQLDEGSLDLILVLDFEISPTLHCELLRSTPP